MLSLLAKNSTLLYHSFVVFVVQLFDDLNDYAKYHYIYPVPDVNMRRRTATDVGDGTGRASFWRMSKRMDSP